MAQVFSKCPTWWARNGLLKTGFKGGEETGKSIAALKCIIAISHNINFHSLSVSMSFSDIEKLTGLSRPMVSAGLDLISSLGIVEIEKKYRNTYKMVDEVDGDSGWARLPIANLKRELPSLPNRGRVSLFALKFYLQLLADRPNKSTVMHMKYETITEKVGTQPRDIKPSINILFNHDLITVAKSSDGMSSGGKIIYQKNEYTIKGLALNPV
jgi:hypothetical protein